MGKFQGLFKQTIIYGIATVFPRIISFILVRFHTDKSIISETSEYGTFSLVFTYIIVFNVILSYGMETSFFRFYNNEKNKKDVLNFINKYQEIQTCKLLLAKDINFKGLKKSVGDFKLENGLVERWGKNDPHLYYTGLQIINPHIFELIEDKFFSLNVLWDLLIANKNLEAYVSNSTIIHIGDINALNQFKNVGLC